MDEMLQVLFVNFFLFIFTSNPSGETASGDGSHSDTILQCKDGGVDITQRSSSLTVSNRLRVGETGLMTVLFRANVGADCDPRRAKTRSQSFSSTSSSSGDSSIEPSLGADLHRSTGGLNTKHKSTRTLKFSYQHQVEIESFFFLVFKIHFSPFLL